MARICAVVAGAALWLFPAVGFAAADEPVAPAGGLLVEAREGISHVESVISEGQALLDAAQADSDVSRMDCINAQLINARGFLNVVQNGEMNLQDAVRRGDAASQQHHIKLIWLAVSRSDEILSRMAECSSGVASSLAGETKLEVIRVCEVEPCIGGEEYYEPAAASVDLAEGVSRALSVDASPYL